MEVIALQSGSNGNSIYVESNGVRLLFDAGISGKRAQERLAAYGHDICDVHALLISHEHSDHSRSAGIYHRKFGLPVYVTARTLRAARARYCLGEIEDIRHFEAGDVLRFDRVRVETLPTAHDSADGVAFVIDDGTHRLGILTDLGHAFDGLDAVVASLDAVVLESNYDADMLARGPYPPMLKRRIRGSGGHLSNVEAAELLRAAGDRMQWVCLAHMSEDNNHPQLALNTHRAMLGKRLPLFTATRYEASAVLEV